MTIALFIFTFWAAFLLGFAARTWLIGRLGEYSGTIVVDKDKLTETTVYSLILDEYPEKLEFKKMVIFRVLPPEESSDRD